MFTINPRSATPIYEQLEQNIISMVAAGVLLPDDQLPSVRAMARDLGVNPNTVQKAYGRLEEKGILYQAAGRGSFVAPVETAVSRIAQEKREALSSALLEAKQAGVSRAEILKLLDSLFGEEQS